jgi:hypothetical protein
MFHSFLMDRRFFDRACTAEGCSGAWAWHQLRVVATIIVSLWKQYKADSIEAMLEWSAH